MPPSASTSKHALREGRADRESRYRGFTRAVEDARTRLEAELDETEYRIAVDPDAPPSTRLRAIQAIRRRVFQQGRRSDHILRSSHAQESRRDVDIAGSRSLVTDHQRMSAPTEILRRLLSTLRMRPVSESRSRPTYPKSTWASRPATVCTGMTTSSGDGPPAFFKRL